MKKRIHLIILITIFCLSGCSHQSSATNDKPNQICEEDFYVYSSEDGSLKNYPSNSKLSFVDNVDGIAFEKNGGDENYKYQTFRGIKVHDAAKVAFNEYDLSWFNYEISKWPSFASPSDADKNVATRYFESYPELSEAVKHTHELENNLALFIYCYAAVNSDGGIEKLDPGYKTKDLDEDVTKVYELYFYIRDDNIFEWGVREWDVEKLRETAYLSEQTRTDDYKNNELNYITVGNIGLYVPSNWKYLIRDDGVELSPSESTPWIFSVFPIEISSDESISLYNRTDQSKLSQAITSSVSSIFDKCVWLRTLQDMEYCIDEKTSKTYLTIVYDVELSGNEGSGTIDVFYIDNVLWGIFLFDSHDAMYNYSYDEYALRRSIMSKDAHISYGSTALNEEDLSNDGSEEEIDTNEDESNNSSTEESESGDADASDVNVLYDKFINDLKSGGIITSVDDSGGPVDGVWIFYVNDNWYSLSESEKQQLADSILLEINAWANGMYGLTPTIVIEDSNGKTVAESNFSATSMKIK